MSDIKDVTLEFLCPETLNHQHFCAKSSRRLTDFTNKTGGELIEEIQRSKGPVCGIFKKVQLSDQFLKYAAATVIATSLTLPSLGQEPIKVDTLKNAIESIEEEDDDVFFGMIVELQAEPICGYKKFMETIASNLNYPPGLHEKGRSFVEFTIDTTGQMRDIKLIKGFNELADREAVRVLSTLNYPFTPARQRGKPVRSRLVIPIVFDPVTKEKK